jgi:hypothetical protein
MSQKSAKPVSQATRKQYSGEKRSALCWMAGVKNDLVPCDSLSRPAVVDQFDRPLNIFSG